MGRKKNQKEVYSRGHLPSETYWAAKGAASSILAFFSNSAAAQVLIQRQEQSPGECRPGYGLRWSAGHQERFLIQHQSPLLNLPGQQPQSVSGTTRIAKRNVKSSLEEFGSEMQFRIRTET